MNTSDIFPLPDAATVIVLQSIFTFLWIVGTSATVLSVYMLLYHSPETFGMYKWVQLSIALPLFFTDTLSFLASFWFIPKYIGAVSLSPFHLSFEAIFVIGCTVLYSINMQSFFGSVALYYRCYKLLSVNVQTILRRGHTVFFAAVGLSLLFVPYTLLSIGPDMARKATETAVLSDPFMSPLKNTSLVHVVFPRDNPYLFMFLRYNAVICELFLCYETAVIYGFYVTLYKPNPQLSRRTREIQKRALYSLLLQIVVPLVTSVTPFTILLLSNFVIKLIPYKLMCGSPSLLNCLHSTLNGAILITFTKPYRKVFTGYFFFTNLVKSQKVIKQTRRVSTNVSERK